MRKCLDPQSCSDQGLLLEMGRRVVWREVGGWVVECSVGAYSQG